MPDVDSSATSGLEIRGYRRGAVSTDGWDQYVVPVRDRITSFRGRATTFVTPGRAATAHKILAIFNSSTSTVLVSVNRIRVDLLSTVAKTIVTIPPVIRVHRVSAVPTNGTALSKAKFDSNQLSDAQVTVWGDSSADNAGNGTSSATTLTATTSAPALEQAWAPRVAAFAVPATGSNPFYEPIDTIEFFVGDSDVTLRANEGLCVFIDLVTATNNPTTDKWLASVDWEEYTRP